MMGGGSGGFGIGGAWKVGAGVESVGGEIVMVGMVGDEQGIKEGEEEVAQDVGFEGEIKV
jgi:hypothetical protein